MNNEPTNGKDPSGKWFIIDDIMFAVGGTLVGLGSQAISDLWHGNEFDIDNYIAAGGGGAVGGWTLLYVGPVPSGLAAGATTNAIRQGLKYAKEGKQPSFEDFVLETATGGVAGKVPLGFSRWGGVASGRNSCNAIYERMATSFFNGTVRRISTKTALKMFAGRTVKEGFLPGTLLATELPLFIKGHEGKGKGVDFFDAQKVGLDRPLLLGPETKLPQKIKEPILLDRKDGNIPWGLRPEDSITGGKMIR